MKTKPYDVGLVDPEDRQWAREWAARRAAAVLKARLASDRMAEIDDILGHEPALRLKEELDEAAGDKNAAVEAESAALGKLTGAEALVATFIAQELSSAQGALDDSIRAVSDALADLLRRAQVSTASTATVDGLALRERYAAATAGPVARWDHTTIPFHSAGSSQVDPELNFPVVGHEHHDALLDVLARLDERIDAIADLVTAESVHQLVQGNPVRSGAALDVATSGGVPDTFEVVRTPTRGYDITHRVLALVDPTQSAAWQGARPGAGFAADPLLAAWVSGLLPDPAVVRVIVRRVDPGTGLPGNPVDLSADVLGLDPVAWVQLGHDPAEIHQRIARAARSAWAASLGEAAWRGRVLIESGTISGAGSALTLNDMIAAASTVHDLLARTRALTGDDLAKPAATGNGVVDAVATQSVVDRVREVEQRVRLTCSALETASTGQDRDALIDALFAASALGEAAATPEMDASTPPLQILREQAATVLTRLQARTAEPFVADPGDGTDTVRRGRERIAVLCGMRLPVLTPLLVPSREPWESDVYGPTTSLGSAEPEQVRTWLHLHARVRPAVAATLTAYAFAEAFGASSSLDVRATQIVPGPPPSASDPRTWVARDAEPPPGSASFVVLRPPGSDRAVVPERLAGLAVDTWTQVVPAAQHSTGIAFHFDEPDATAPQALLVAVGPDLREGRQPATWDLATLLDVLTTTMALTRDRAVAGENAGVSGLTLGDLS